MRGVHQSLYLFLCFVSPLNLAGATLGCPTHLKQLVEGLVPVTNLNPSPARAIPDELRNAIISPTDFFAGYTIDGVVFHGTSIDRGVSIARTKQLRLPPSGVPAFFSTPGYSYAAIHAFSYHSDQGVVLPFRFKNVQDMLIVNGDQLPEGIALADVGDRFGVDVVVAGMPGLFDPQTSDGSKVMIFDPSVLQLPSAEDIVLLADRQIQRRENEDPGSTHILVLEAYEHLYQAMGLGLRVTNPQAYLVGRDRSPEIIDVP